jgi:hypothetical protein
MRNRKLAKLLALGLEPENVSPKINRRNRKAGLTKPAPLPVANAVSSEHPSFFGKSITELPQLQNDLAVIYGAYRRLEARLATRESQLEARVAVAESALECLGHNQAECLKFIHSGTLAAPISNAPSEKVPAELPAHLAGSGYPASTQKVADGSPFYEYSLDSQRTAAAVPLVNEARHPETESVISDDAWLTACLQSRGLLKQPPRLTRFVCYCVAQLRRLLHSLTRRVTKFDPEVGAAPVETSHIEDGFGSSWSIRCPECGQDSMQVVRPGKAQCSNCG